MGCQVDDHADLGAKSIVLQGQAAEIGLQIWKNRLGRERTETTDSDMGNGLLVPQRTSLLLFPVHKIFEIFPFKSNELPLPEGSLTSLCYCN